MQLHELTNFLESIADLSLQESYDNSGLIYGDPEMTIDGVLCSLDCTREVLMEAKERKCNVVVSHHPILFSGIKKFNRQHYVDQAIIHAIKNEIAIYAIHTNLDNVFQNGVNQKIAQKLDLQGLEILLPKPGTKEIGAGIKGQLKQSLSATDFLSLVKSQLNTAVIRHTRIVKNQIQKVAVAGGSGSFLIKEAIQSGADAFVTADIKYHDFFDADDRILLVDVGHYESEQFTIELLFELISQKFRNFATHYTKTSTNPVLYF
jgi:dinuclear metal center YbgI/SA1388 family protein